MIRGEFVKSTAGSDSGKIYIVLGCDADRVVLADGERHVLSSPKRKNKKHVCITGLQIDVPKTDALLVTAIRRVKPLID